MKGALNVAFDAARTTAQSFAVLVGSTPSGARRDQFNAIMRRVLEQNPGFNGTYSAWEPNAIDGADAAFVNNRAKGSDDSGRYLPYWTRAANGSVAIQPLVEYNSAERHPNGLVKGGWYLGPRTNNQESILGPLPYTVQGKRVFLATMSVPISAPVSPAEIAADAPPLDPPGPQVRSHGLFVVPKISLYACASADQRGKFVLPKMTAPASRTRATTSASVSGT